MGLISYQSQKKISASIPWIPYDSMAGHDFRSSKVFFLGTPIDDAKSAGPLHVGGPRRLVGVLRKWEGDDLPRVFGRAN